VKLKEQLLLVQLIMSKQVVYVKHVQVLHQLV